jgi:histone-lysine N-methyltransferase SETMAR
MGIIMGLSFLIYKTVTLGTVFVECAVCELSHVLYCKTLKDLRDDIQNKRHGRLTSDIVLLHDNACLHTAVHTQALLKHFNCELFDYLSYSPDLTPTDYHLLTYLKNWLPSQRFRVDGR